MYSRCHLDAAVNLARTGFKAALGCNRLRSPWLCVVGKKGSRPTTVGLRAFFTSGLDHGLLAQFRYEISFETSSTKR